MTATQSADPRSSGPWPTRAVPSTDEPANPGGPQTPEGKLACHRNSLRHGLTAKKLLPEVLQPGRLAGLLRLFRQEYQPATPSEEVLVAELARHAAALELGEAAEWAILRQGATTLARVALSRAGDEDDAREKLLSAAVTSEPLDVFSRYRRAHEMGFLAALGRLRERKAANRSARPQQSGGTRVPFDTEADCERFLEDRFRCSDYRCPHCGHHGGCWLASRARWQCRGCRRQLGLRAGTVFARSRLPLVQWFGAIRAVLLDPAIRPAELSQKARIARTATVRQVAAKIRSALATPSASELLAGLDRLFSSNSMTR